MKLKTMGLDNALLKSLKDYIDTFDNKENNIISILLIQLLQSRKGNFPYIKKALSFCPY